MKMAEDGYTWEHGYTAGRPDYALTLMDYPNIYSFIHTHGLNPEAVRQVAKEEDVPCIDMTTLTETYLSVIGDFASRAMYVYPKDNTHLVMQGAMVYAGFIADGLRKLGHPYVDLLVARDAKTVDDDRLLSADPYMPLGQIGKPVEIRDNIDAAFRDETVD